MSETIKVRILSNFPYDQTVAGVHVRGLCCTVNCVVGKVYEAVRVPKGVLDPDGCVTFAEGCVAWVDEVGDNVVAYIGAPAFEVVEGVE